MEVPEKTHSGNLNRSKVVAQPDAGARQMAGKTCNADSAITDAKKYKPEAVRQVDPNANKGVVAKCVEQQGGTQNNPKRRTDNVWGGPTVKGTGKEN
ncbi:MAG TPA: hypothetical protein VFR24_00150 [Candidatus Angelobacter sp.]|nr:hypothetical protein [Candidatus Angelobacter sp.]